MPKIQNHTRPKPLVLAVTEGWGVAPLQADQAFVTSQPRQLLDLMSHYPAASLTTGENPGGEQGHKMIGLGRNVRHLRDIINDAVENGTLEKHLEPVAGAARFGRLHLISLLSRSDKEASFSQFLAILDWIEEHNVSNEIFIHVILDGRDTAAKTGKQMIKELESRLGTRARIATVTGRMYALDIYNQPARLQRATQAIAEANGNQIISIEQALAESYEKKIFDEEFAPTVLLDTAGQPIGKSQSGDTVLFCHHTAIALRPLAEALVTARVYDHYFSLAALGNEQIVPLFESDPVKNSLSEVISAAGLRQLRLSDSEGYGFVTTALNGGTMEPWPLEERYLLPFSARPVYADQLMQQQKALTKEVQKAVIENRHDVIIVTFSGLDRITHAGTGTEVSEMITTLDDCLARLAKTVLEHDGVLIWVGSHGLAEQVISEATTTESRHTGNPVPCLLIGKAFAGLTLRLGEVVGGDLSARKPAGSLANIAPTMLSLLRLPIPSAMTGKSFF